MEIHQHSEMCECDVVHTDVVAHVKEVMDKALEEYIRKYLPDKL